MPKKNKSSWVKRLKKDIKTLLTGPGHSPAGRNLPDRDKILASRRRLNKQKKQMEKMDKKIGEGFKTIDRLHKEQRRLLGKDKK